ncbi:hypothetical protein HDU93_009862 [Gonapodya sp. JEL0774]|nr:hypothetical protein HDU93_009862 [Gonapodya sp. JEL0774]
MAPPRFAPSDLDIYPASRTPNAAAVRGRMRAFIAGDLLASEKNPHWSEDERKGLLDEVENLVDNLKYYIGVVGDAQEVEEMPAFPGSSNQFFYHPLDVRRAAIAFSVHPAEKPELGVTFLYTVMSCSMDDSVAGFWGRITVWNGLPPLGDDVGTIQDDDGGPLVLLEGGEEWDPTGGQTPMMQVDRELLVRLGERLGVKSEFSKGRSAACTKIKGTLDNMPNENRADLEMRSDQKRWVYLNSSRRKRIAAEHAKSPSYLVFLQRLYRSPVFLVCLCRPAVIPDLLPAHLLSILVYLATNPLEHEHPSFSSAAHSGITRSSLQHSSRRGHTHADPDEEPVSTAVLVFDQFGQLDGTVTYPTFNLVADVKDNILTEMGWFEVVRRELVKGGTGDAIGEGLADARRKRYGLEEAN